MYVQLLQVILAKGIGDVALKKYLTYINDNNIMEESMLESEVLHRVGFKDHTVRHIFENREKAESTFSKLISKGFEIVTELSEHYPQSLKNTLQDKCPPLLFVKGNKDLLSQIGVGFCGSRDVSQKGMRVAISCAQELVEKNVTIVSGYAMGTDLTAHAAALEKGGNTIFVLAEGVFNYSIKKQISNLLTDKNHLFVSQFIPDVTWNVGNAMKRNSTIIGLSRAMILVESKLQGGTFASGEESLRVKCPLFVIDFSKPEVSAEANPYFIGKGGLAIRGNKEGVPNLRKLFDIINSDYRSNRVHETTSINCFL